MGNIVVGVDGSSWSKKALSWALEEAKRRDAVVQAVMVWNDPSRDMWIPHVEPRGDPLALTRHVLEKTVKEVAGDHPEVAVEPLAVVGAPARTLVELARGAELLVVGNRGRGGFAGVMLGSVSFHCVSHAPCPVVVVRSDTEAP